MYGDAGKRTYGMTRVQQLTEANPMRWSGEQDYEKTMTDMRKIMEYKEHKERPILMRAPATGTGTPLVRHEGAEAAIKFLEEKCPKKSAHKQKLGDMEMKCNDANN